MVEYFEMRSSSSQVLGMRRMDQRTESTTQTMKVGMMRMRRVRKAGMMRRVKKRRRRQRTKLVRQRSAKRKSDSEKG